MISLSPKHYVGAGLSVGGVIGLVTEGINWANSHLSATGTSICANGLSPAVVTTVASGLGLVTTIGVIILAFAPSVKDETNVKAGISSGKRLSTVPPAPTTTEIK